MKLFWYSTEVICCDTMKSEKISRSYSDKFLAGSGDYDLLNKNVEWMSGPFLKLCYVVVVLSVWALIHVSTFFSAEDCWTVTNILHGVVRELCLLILPP